MQNIRSKLRNLRCQSCCDMHHLAVTHDQCHQGHSLKEILRLHNTTTQNEIFARLAPQKVLNAVSVRLNTLRDQYGKEPACDT